jgi:hypothetical protein
MHLDAPTISRAVSAIRHLHALLAGSACTQRNTIQATSVDNSKLHSHKQTHSHLLCCPISALQASLNCQPLPGHNGDALTLSSVNREYKTAQIYRCISSHDLSLHAVATISHLKRAVPCISLFDSSFLVLLSNKVMILLLLLLHLCREVKK